MWWLEAKYFRPSNPEVPLDPPQQGAFSILGIVKQCFFWWQYVPQLQISPYSVLSNNPLPTNLFHVVYANKLLRDAWYPTLPDLFEIRNEEFIREGNLFGYDRTVRYLDPQLLILGPFENLIVEYRMRQITLFPKNEEWYPEEWDATFGSPWGIKPVTKERINFALYSLTRSAAYGFTGSYVF